MKSQGFTDFFIKRPTLFWSLMVVILLLGIYAFVMMPKLEDPAVCAKQAMVVAVYPGATAHEVELKVVEVLEKRLRTLPDVYEIRSECQAGMAMITVEFEMTVLNNEIEQHFDLLRRKVNDVAQLLPSGCYAPMVVDDMMDVYGLLYAFVSDGYSYPEMTRYGKLIQRELMTVKGVKRVNVVGTRPEVINLIVSKERLATNGMIPVQLMMALQNAGKTVSAGKYADGSDRIQLQVNHELDDEEDIANLLIKTADGNVIRVGDIAEVERAYREPQQNGFFVNGKQALAICIATETDAIVPDVGRAVDKKMAEVMKRVPAGMTTEKIFFQPDKVNDAINSFMLNLIESVLIVILVLIFSYGFRSGLIIGGGLLMTIAVSFPVLLALGSTLQRISLGAFIVAMGMLVDNSIVIMDGILVDRQHGMPQDKYLYNIGNKTALPLLAATVIAVSTFVGVYLSPDSAGEYCHDMFLVLCISLMASWVLALIQVPMCAKTFLPAAPSGAELKNCKDLLNTPLHRVVRKMVNSLINHKAVTITCAFALLIACAVGMLFVKNLFFPDFDYNQFVIEYQLPSQSSSDRVKSDLLAISSSLSEKPEVERVTLSMGSAPAHYCLVRPMQNGGDSYGELMVDCKDFKTVNKIIPVLRQQLRAQYPDAYIRFRKYNFSISTSHTVEVAFQGPDPAVLRRLSSQAEDIMRRCEYVDPYSVGNNWHAKSKTLVADYIEQDALRAGINRGNVADALCAATDGLPIGVVNDNDDMVVVNLMVRNQDGTKITDLRDIPVWSMLNLNLSQDELTGLFSGATKIDELQNKLFRSTTLSNITNDIMLRFDEDFVYRVNGQRTIEAQCDPNTGLYQGTPAKVEQEIKDKIAAIELPEGYSMYWAGEGKLKNQAMTNILKFVPLTMAIIVLILLLMFNNWKEVGSVLICLPFALCGIVPSLLLFRQPFTFMAVLGMMGLLGMMTKNGIVLIDEINRLYKVEHQSAYHAVVEATVSRVRPVILASLTTILGMAPLLGDPMYGSMAITIMSGLTVGTIITLILLPIFYSAFFHVKNTGQQA